MRCARLDFADPDHPVTLAEVHEPALPRADWARVAVKAGGICGSDLHAIFPDGIGTPTFLPLDEPVPGRRRRLLLARRHDGRGDRLS